MGQPRHATHSFGDLEVVWVAKWAKVKATCRLETGTGLELDRPPTK